MMCGFYRTTRSTHNPVQNSNLRCKIVQKVRRKGLDLPSSLRFRCFKIGHLWSHQGGKTFCPTRRTEFGDGKKWDNHCGILYNTKGIAGTRFEENAHIAQWCYGTTLQFSEFLASIALLVDRHMWNEYEPRSRCADKCERAHNVVDSFRIDNPMFNKTTTNHNKFSFCRLAPLHAKVHNWWSSAEKWCFLTLNKFWWVLNTFVSHFSSIWDRRQWF